MRELCKRAGAALLRPVALTLAVALVLALGPLLLGSGHVSRAVAEPGFQEAAPYTDAGVPAEEVVMIGATPAEPDAPGSQETWGLGTLKEGKTVKPELVRYVVHPAEAGGGEEGTWTPGPSLPEGFVPDTPRGNSSPLAGQMTPEGYGVLAGEKEMRQVLLVRKPGEAEGAFIPTGPVPAEGEVKAGEEPLLHTGQMLFGKQRAPMIAPLAESDGSAGALVVPVYEGAGVDEAVLHWDGHTWTREPIEIPTASKGEFHVLGLAASGPENAWLIARLSSGADALFHRVKEAAGYSWQPVEVEVDPGQVQLPLAVPVAGGAPASGEPFTVSGAGGSAIEVESQVLTVTSAGLWVDGVRTDIERQQPFTTIYLKPEGSKAAIERSWCNAAQGSPACQATLPQEPPQQYGRSIAWANGSQPFGERVIAGLPEGVSLRLEGERFVPVLALGGGEKIQEIPGALYGAAFSSPTEGWLGNGTIPVHLTLSSQADRLRNWPVATRHPLYAIAPQPGAPVGALTSEALAVGDDGAVARYRPGQGWLPETLFGPGERVETPRLRAVAWPTPNRAFAVGESGEMWLWRGETGLWERDPATPINFRDNLDGIAFDPTNPARGYAVGSRAVGRGSVILRYGKTWTEETDLPEAVKDAYFTGIAFAGSEAIVSYRVQPELAVNSYVGGLLVNDGSGWTVDQEEQQVSGGAPPISVAGLPDGGAAVLAGEGADYVYERQNGGSPWQRVPIPVPGELAGALSLFRQGGALRALVAGGGAGAGAEALRIESAPGFPPLQQPVSGVGAGLEAGSLLRQTAAGWRDERHSLNTVKQGQFYEEYDTPNRPDPLFAVLVGPEGTEGWAVGGIASAETNEETADVERYPAEGQPPNEGASTVPVTPEEATPGATGGVTTLAFGGQAQCKSPCAERTKTGIGPQTWLSSAVSLAKGIGAAAFFYTGPMVHPSAWQGRIAPPLPFEAEYERYAGILGAGGPWPAYAASAEGELGGEATEASEFAGLAAPLGGGGSAGWQPAGGSPSVAERASCGCEAAYYAIQNAHVEVIVLDDSGANGLVQAAQRVWLEQQLQQAGAVLHKPVIVVANADLSQQLSAGRHEEAAEQLFAALAGQNPDGPDTGHYAASAYFYDAPETNVKKTFAFHGATLAMFGSGTLGYELEQNEASSEFHGAKGIMLGEVLWAQGSAAERAADVAPVHVRLIPVLGELALETEDGTLLPRSRPALFRGLARRPRAGCRATSGENECEEGQYIPIPAICVGSTCQTEAVLPEYEYASSAPDIGAFVKLNTAAGNPLSSSNPAPAVPSSAVLQNAKGEPIPDGYENASGEQVGATSGLFCAYNKGVTDVSIRAGGLSYTVPVTVQAGSVRQPCGTVPLRHLPAAAQAAAAPAPPPAPAPAPTGPAPASSPPPVPVPPPPAVPAAIPAPPARAAPTPPPFFLPPVPVTPLLAFVPPPVPTPARPTPPSGTSAVTSPVEIAEHEEEEESATESVSNQALAYHAPEHEPSPVYILGVVLLAAFAGAVTLRGRPRRGRRPIRVAPATLSTQRAQRRIGGGEERRW